MKWAVTAVAGIVVVAGVVTYEALSASQPNMVEIGTFVVLSLTLVALIWYAFDTHSIADVTRQRWMREGVLSANYGIVLSGEKGDVGHTLFQIANPSNLVVRVLVNCNFRVYGQRVKAGSLYDGEEKWIVFPQQHSQGWFRVEDLLLQRGKKVEDLCRECTEDNRKKQLTMLLELEFWDEVGNNRKLPSRHHYFDFPRWSWIPNLGESQPNP